MPFIVHVPDSDAFERAVPEEADRYFVGGIGDNVVLIPWPEGPESDEAYERYRAIWRGEHCGVVGLSPEGYIVVFYDRPHRDVKAMDTATCQLARMTPFAERRRKSEAAICWLDSQYALPDTRPESGAAHA